jgi:hypothetical protein
MPDGRYYSAGAKIPQFGVAKSVRTASRRGLDLAYFPDFDLFALFPGSGSRGTS